MVFRIFVEKKPGLANEAAALKNDINELLQIKAVKEVRVFNRYDVDNISKELFDYSVNTVFSEPQLDIVTYELPEADRIFAVEYLPGQFDQRASSAAECIQIISKGERPAVRTAKVYALYGDISDADIEAIKKYVINAVEARECDMDLPETLKAEYEIPTSVETVEGFRKLSDDELADFIADRGLAMDLADIKVCRKYFEEEDRDPTITEIKMIDTYWSDHCRHTTFNTVIDSVKFEDKEIEDAFDRYIRLREDLGRTKPVTLMDIGTIAVKHLKKTGKLDKLDESEEINACTVKIKVEIDGKDEDWLLLFKNETHNHPTEIEPFGGAATCVGGAIRDPLSGRSYVYAAMRVTGAADPLKPVSETIPGKLPQRKLVTTAAAGYSSYGNQIGLATGQVDEIYHPGYVAKRMEIGAVIAAAPAENVIRKVPAPGDRVILLGGKTGRDGCGGATGSSKSHDVSSLESCGAEVQKGNAPEERKLQRLFRNPEASKLIKRCNDFGAGGVSVAIGELADGLSIDLNKVPKKYEGLDGTELAISESQERMAVVVAEKDVDKFCNLARNENLEATVVACVTSEPRLSMQWNGKTIVNISREFLDSNGAEKHTCVVTQKPQEYEKKVTGTFAENYKSMAGDLNICSKRGLSERFDSTIGAGTVLMPFGGKYQRTPIQAMVNKVSVEKKDTRTCSLMAWGYNPFITEKSPYHGAYLAVVESVSKLIAEGASFEDVYLSFQEYFEKLGHDPEKWGQPFAALLGAFDAQMALEVGSIGGKDSMSGTFENIHVPPTLVSFAVTVDSTDNIISPEFKNAGNNVYLMKPECGENGLPLGDSLKELYGKVTKMMREGRIKACYTPGMGGIAEAILKMTMGNNIGFEYSRDISVEEMFKYNYGAFVAEVEGEADGILIGRTTDDESIAYGNDRLSFDELFGIYEDKLESVYPCNIKTDEEAPANISFVSEKKFTSAVKVAKPKALIPVFPGTNCEYDTAKAFDKAGAEPEIFIINNLTSSDVARSVETFAAKVRQSQMVFIPGGFSGGDEPDGSGKFITAFFRNQEIKEAVTELLEERDGLMAGICNGFQALIKLGLVPFGKIMDTDETFPTLTYNKIGRHQSKLVQIRIASNNSPWLAATEVGDVYTVPVSHGEGRFMASPELLDKMASDGRIITQYVDMSGNASSDIQFNPNGSDWAVEGIVSPDGRVLGKMGHAERIGNGLYKNVPGHFDMKMFESAVKYFK
ncbi:MAG: phosphoribosylformylglycinamidine synthase [Clostridiales bacterium]|nr:phosphoribosylformylglycinamidine synthase [Anaerovoracaceae bacterium]PWL93482.1 MAG: phosphoribosylformylglycinamidine synthase [Clostridiales bacterium]